MILTVTPNSALDRIFFIEEWTPGLPIRIERMVTAVGGKGLDASVSLSCQDVPSTALTFLAGQIGREVADLLAVYGITAVPVWVEGETRVAHVVAERKFQRHTHLIAGQMQISSADVQTFYDRLSGILPDTSWMVLGSSMPPGLDTGIFARLIELAHEAGIPSLVDTSALPIEPVIAARPTILKINEVEFAAAFKLEIRTLEDLLQKASQVKQETNLPNLIITRGEKGLVALTAEGNFLVQAPVQIPVNAAGAGDAISGSLPYHLAQGETWAEALIYATAVSAATVLTEATAECRLADVHRILPQVQLSRLTCI